MIHRFPLRVYYEDTDLAGIVYYANYLKFIERARSEFVRELGVDQVAMKRDAGQVFVVRRVEADYLASAHFDDALVVETWVEAVKGVRLIMRQEVKRGDDRLFSALVTIAMLDAAGKPQRLPAVFRQIEG